MCLSNFRHISRLLALRIGSTNLNVDYHRYNQSVCWPLLLITSLIVRLVFVVIVFVCVLSLLHSLKDNMNLSSASKQKRKSVNINNPNKFNSHIQSLYCATLESLHAVDVAHSSAPSFSKFTTNVWLFKEFYYFYSCFFYI